MNPATALSTVLVDELVRNGVTDAVISPGSRSAPLAIALHRHPAVRLHVRIDERSAGFLALGLARHLRRPVPVVCTSGTATANLHPAVLEADQSGVPLLVLTADRPPELRGTGANQTTDQIKLYGSAVRFFAEVGAPEVRTGAGAYWRSLVCRAVAAAGDGPVHLNVALREPLLADRADLPLPEQLAGRPGGAPWTRPEPVAAVPAVVDGGRRGLVIAGDGCADPDAAVAFAAARGWPLLAEPGSNARYGANALSCYPLLLRCAALREQLAPEAIVTVGRPTLSRQVLALYSAGVPHTVVHPGRTWPDPSRTATRVVGALAIPSGGPRRSPWLDAWLRADAAARAAVDGVLDDCDELTEVRLARDLPALLPPDSLLFIGSSNPPRAVDMVMRPRRDLRVTANRGLAGIDGSISTSIGAAIAWQRRGGGPAYALLGDLTFLHDQNGLLLGTGEPHPDLTIVVVNNNGGGIFSLLPYRDLPDGFEQLFGTPHGASLEAAATAAGWKYEAVARASQLPQVLSRGGPLIVEVTTDRARTAASHSQLQATVEQAIGAIGHAGLT